MKINKILNFDFRFPLNEEQRERAKKGMEIIDITDGIPVPSTPKGNDTTLSSEYLSAKQFIQKISNSALKQIGIKRMMSNFSKDYPIKTVLHSDSEVFFKMAADILKDDANAQRCQDTFFALFGEEYDRKLAAYAVQKGKTPDELTDAEHIEVAHDFTSKLGATGFSELLRAQKIAEIFNITQDSPAFEDFNTKKGNENHDRTNFLRKYYHSRAKHGKTVNIEDVENEISASSESRRVEDLINITEFYDQLSEEEKEIIRLKSEGYRETEIAKRLGFKSQGTISKKLKKVGKKAKAYLE